MSTTASVDGKLTSSTQYESLTGVVERLTYHSQESGYSVARLKAVGNRDLITIVGSFANLQAGQTLVLVGFWREHPKYGAQFQVTQYQETKPATITGIEKYLGSGLIKGVGPVTARRIVAHFGLETLDMIENHTERLIEVPGIAKKRIKMIQAAWSTQKAIKEVMLFLQSHGVSTTYAVKIYKQYSDKAIEIVTKNPYQLATDIYGIGFVTADAIRRKAAALRYRAKLGNSPRLPGKIQGRDYSYFGRSSRRWALFSAASRTNRASSATAKSVRSPTKSSNSCRNHV